VQPRLLLLSQLPDPVVGKFQPPSTEEKEDDEL
jgi:hypothetical protein